MKGAVRILSSAKFNVDLVASLAVNLARECHDNGDAVLAMCNLAHAIATLVPSIRIDHGSTEIQPRVASEREAACSLLLSAVVSSAVDLGVTREHLLASVAQSYDLVTVSLDSAAAKIREHAATTAGGN